jgi:hypothetical protein
MVALHDLAASAMSNASAAATINGLSQRQEGQGAEKRQRTTPPPPLHGAVLELFSRPFLLAAFVTAGAAFWPAASAQNDSTAPAGSDFAAAVQASPTLRRLVGWGHAGGGGSGGGAAAGGVGSRADAWAVAVCGVCEASLHSSFAVHARSLASAAVAFLSEGGGNSRGGESFALVHLHRLLLPRWECRHARFFEKGETRKSFMGPLCRPLQFKTAKTRAALTPLRRVHLHQRQRQHQQQQ